MVQVVGPADGWILERLGRRLEAKLPYATYSVGEPDRALGEGIAYYVNYAIFKGETSFIDVGFFTHLEDSHDFLGRARDMDWCVCMSKKYADWLREQGVEHVTHIPMGFDYYRYRARLVLSVIGKLDHPRKGRQLVERVRELPFVEVVTTEGQIDDEQLRHVYQSTDYVLIPATIEGGPMSLLEGLAMGKPVIAPDDVGMVPEFGEMPNLRRYRTGDFESLAEVLRACYEEKAATTRLVADRTWDRWAEDHHKLFKRLLKERGIPMPEPAPGFRFGMMAELDIPPKLDVTKLETTLDSAARHLYFGRYREVRAEIEGVIREFPFAEKLLETIPNG
jgi:glycosyltransferase involved in cell wall biosynthesis